MKFERILFRLASFTILVFLASCSSNYQPEDIAPSGELITTFEYPRSRLVPIASSAKTTDEQTGKLVAKAELVKFGTNNTLIVRETHYGPKGEIIFTCESEFRTDGFKIGETKTKGKKVFELYDQWPTFSRDF